MLQLRNLATILRKPRDDSCSRFTTIHSRYRRQTDRQHLVIIPERRTATFTYTYFTSPTRTRQECLVLSVSVVWLTGQNSFDMPPILFTPPTGTRQDSMW